MTASTPTKDQREPRPGEALKELAIGTVLFVGGIVLAGLLARALIPADVWWDMLAYGALLGICLAPAIWYAGVVREERSPGWRSAAGLVVLIGIVLIAMAALPRIGLDLDRGFGWIALLVVVVSQVVRRIFGLAGEDERSLDSVSVFQVVLAAIALVVATVIAIFIFHAVPVTYIPWVLLVAIVVFEWAKSKSHKRPPSQPAHLERDGQS